ncbi:MAG: GNAT family N-acetyltransferase [Saprospiraceae bacterium]|nr:GNAT family N-acetyltransferase [Saprospiraceae bacterium]MBK9721764.1 GNAT family N-acetyltransferase [Saprospiraceae bacterium]
MTQIRKALLTDLEPLVKLFDAYRVFYKKESDTEGAQRFLADRFINGESIIFIAETITNEIVGFVQLYPLFSSTRMKRLWLLNDLYVDPVFRNKKISIALIDACKKHCLDSDGCGVILETAKSNIIGNQLYPKAKFTLDQEHNYYSWEVE